MLKRPLFPVTIAFVIGILFTGVFHVPVYVALGGFGFGFACAIAWKKYPLALIFVIASIGLLRYDSYMTLSVDDVSHFTNTGVTGVIGRVISDIDQREDRVMFTLAVRSVRINGRSVPATGRLMTTYYMPDNDLDWNPPDYGDVLAVGSRISSPSGASNPGAFSWKDYLSRQRIHAVMYIQNPRQVKVIRNESPNPLLSAAMWIKRGLSDSIARSMPRDEGAVVAGMALGTYTTLPDRLMDNFTRTGTLHLLAASGFNCAVLVVVFGFLLRNCLKLEKRHVHLALIFILILYMFVVGAKPSIVRATIMATLLLLGALINRPSDTLNLLFAAALIILAINPADIFDVGFQLSFAAVMALILVLPVIEHTSRQWKIDPGARYRTDAKTKAARLVLNEGWQGLLATIAATIGTLPLSAQYFNQFSLVSFLVNAIVAATVLPIFTVGLLLPVFSPVPVLGDILSFTGTMITRFALSTINWFGELPSACLYVTSPGALGVVGYYIVLAAGLYYAYSRINSAKRTTRS
ncbi:MAG: ComEC/Rec2 family competence protein [Armatimonadota bacterium]